MFGIKPLSPPTILPKIDSSRDSIFLSERPPHRYPRPIDGLALNPSGGQPAPPPAPSPFQDLPPILTPHPSPESMLPFSLDLTWLISPFHIYPKERCSQKCLKYLSNHNKKHLSIPLRSVLPGFSPVPLSRTLLACPGCPNGGSAPSRRKLFRSSSVRHGG